MLLQMLAPPPLTSETFKIGYQSYTPTSFTHTHIHTYMHTPPLIYPGAQHTGAGHMEEGGAETK